METERIDLGNRQWWEVRTTLTRAMEKAITRASMGSIPPIRLEPNMDAEKIRAQLLSQASSVDIGAIEDVYLLKGTVAFSFGDNVSIEVIDGLDANMVRTVLDRMYQLYNPQRVTEAQRDGFFAKP